MVKMLKHTISPGTSERERTNHSIDSYSSERNLDRSHLERSFQERCQTSHADRSGRIYGNALGPGYPINGHVPTGEGHLHGVRTSNGQLAGRPSRCHPLESLSASKHSLGGGTSSTSGASPPGNSGSEPPRPPTRSPHKMANGGLDIVRSASVARSPNGSVLLPANVTDFISRSKEAGAKEMLTSLGLLCLVSLLLALLSLIFLLKITPLPSAEAKDLVRSERLTIISPEEYVVVYEISLALCSLTLSLNLCCLLVCAVQFLFAVKLVKASEHGERTNKYLQKSNATRICAVGGFFVSIPVFLTGIILYTFIQFHSTPAIITSSLIGAGIVFCGCAMVHNVFVWQMEKTNAVRALARQTQAARLATAASGCGGAVVPEDVSSGGVHLPKGKEAHSGQASAGLPPATLDLSRLSRELSTLV